MQSAFFLLRMMSDLKDGQLYFMAVRLASASLFSRIATGTRFYFRILALPSRCSGQAAKEACDSVRS